MIHHLSSITSHIKLESVFIGRTLTSPSWVPLDGYIVQPRPIKITGNYNVQQILVKEHISIKPRTGLAGLLVTKTRHFEYYNKTQIKSYVSQIQTRENSGKHRNLRSQIRKQKRRNHSEDTRNSESARIEQI